MARGSKSSYTSKQKRMAHHIEEGAKKHGKSAKRAAQIGWATVNKETGGAGHSVKSTKSSKKGGSHSHRSTSHSHSSHSHAH